MTVKFRDFYCELYIDICVNVATFCLTDEQKKELREHLEKYWHEHQKEELLEEAHEKVFQIRLRELLDE